MITVRTPRYWIWFRIISIIVIITFVTTQFDLRLAFAYPSSNVLPQNSSLPVDLKGNKDSKDDLFGNVRYSSDPTGTKPEEPQPTIDTNNFQKPTEPVNLLQKLRQIFYRQPHPSAVQRERFSALRTMVSKRARTRHPIV